MASYVGSLWARHAIFPLRDEPKERLRRRLQGKTQTSKLASVTVSVMCECQCPAALMGHAAITRHCRSLFARHAHSHAPKLSAGFAFNPTDFARKRETAGAQSTSSSTHLLAINCMNQSVVPRFISRTLGSSFG